MHRVSIYIDEAGRHLEGRTVSTWKEAGNSLGYQQSSYCPPTKFDQTLFGIYICEATIRESLSIVAPDREAPIHVP